MSTITDSFALLRRAAELRELLRQSYLAMEQTEIERRAATIHHNAAWRQRWGFERISGAYGRDLADLEVTIEGHRGELKLLNRQYESQRAKAESYRADLRALDAAAGRLGLVAS